MISLCGCLYKYMYMWMCVCEHAYVCMCLHVYRNQRAALSVIPQVPATLCIDTESLYYHIAKIPGQRTLAFLLSTHFLS